ncbi:hypothetical protein LCGC14_2053620 [marine sediment metagenome]|uniref:Uncharacterized protein n=1 Tax=marine sediment metagenome TaxID=412755 RepID=A0A0F9FAQ0_9ZZZZ
MKNELDDAWGKRVEDDKAAVEEIANRFYGRETEFSSEELVQMSLQERAKIHGCHVAASWEYDYSHHLGTIMEHTSLSLSEALLFLVFLELKRSK